MLQAHFSYLVLALLNALFLVLGCFLHSAAAIILVVPIVLPICTRSSSIWFISA